MKSTRILILIFLSALMLAAGCSSGVVHPLVSRNSAVSRDKALIVMGVSFWEIYNDTQDDQTKKLYSADLLKDSKNVGKKLEKKDGTVLQEPLHYLSNFRFQFIAPGDIQHEFVRFNLDTREYQPIAIHEFAPGSVRLVKITTDQHRFQPMLHSRGQDEEWKKFWVDYEEPFGTWQLEQGKITYMGHLTLYFKSERFVRGLITPRELISSIRILAIVVEDRYEETLKRLQEEKPWFPATEMENQAQPGKWIYDEAGFEQFSAAPVTDIEKEGQREIKRDLKKFFF